MEVLGRLRPHFLNYFLLNLKQDNSFGSEGFRTIGRPQSHNTRTGCEFIMAHGLRSRPTLSSFLEVCLSIRYIVFLLIRFLTRLHQYASPNRYDYRYRFRHSWLCSSSITHDLTNCSGNKHYTLFQFPCSYFIFPLSVCCFFFDLGLLGFSVG